MNEPHSWTACRIESLKGSVAFTGCGVRVHGRFSLSSFLFPGSHNCGQRKQACRWNAEITRKDGFLGIGMKENFDRGYLVAVGF